MKKIFLVIILLMLIASCEEIPNDVIDIKEENFAVKKIEAPSFIKLTEQSTELVTYLQLNSEDNVEKITAKVTSLDGRYSIGTTTELKDDGAAPDETADDLKFTTSYTLTESIPTDNYLIEYYITSVGTQRKVAVKNFRYDNGTANAQPVLSNIIAPDSLVVTDTVAFAVSVKVNDDNGSSDIQSVYFIVTRPDGVSSGTPTFLFDDGNLLGNGDETANDGRYSRIIIINQNNLKGIYQLDFQAEDKGNKKSEILTHKFLVQ